MQTDYRFGFFDAQIILVTDYHLLKARNRLTKSALITKFYQTVVKCIRDYCNCDKVILLWDKGPYHRSKIVSGHKGNRFYITQEVIDNAKENTKIVPKQERDSYIIELIKENQSLPQEQLDEIIANYKETHKTEEEYQEWISNLTLELEQDKIKNEAKYWIIENLGNFGMPSLIYDGYEADDLALMCLQYCYKTFDGRPSYICSKDSDWRYLLTPNSEILRYHRASMETYNEVLTEVPKDLQEKGVGIYLWKAVYDSLRGSHNNFQNCLKDVQFNYDEIFDHLDDKDWLERICDTDVFYPQLNSFKVNEFEDFNEVFADIKEVLSGKYGSFSDEKLFSALTSSNKLDISTKYYSKFKSLVNEDTYNYIEMKEEDDIDQILASL